MPGMTEPDVLLLKQVPALKQHVQPISQTGQPEAACHDQVLLPACDLTTSMIGLR